MIQSRPVSFQIDFNILMGSEMLVRLDRIAIDFSMSDEHDQLTVSVPVLQY